MCTVAEAKELDECSVEKKQMEDAFWTVGNGTSPFLRGARKAIWKRLLPSAQCMEWVSRAESDAQFLANNIREAVPSFGPEGIPVVQQIAEACPGALPAIPLRRIAEQALRATTRADIPEIARKVEARLLSQVTDFACQKPFSAGRSYTGCLCAGIFSPSNNLLIGDLVRPKDAVGLPMNTHCVLQVWVSPIPIEGAWCEEVSLVNSDPTSSEFEIGFEIDCPSIRFPMGRKRRWFDPDKTCEPVKFEFITPAKSGRHQLFVQTIQRELIVHSLFVLFEVS